MLKSTFKKVSAIAIAGTMLAGMMAVPANAMSNETVYDVETINVINENFDNYNTSSSDTIASKTSTAFTQNGNIQYKRYQTWGSSMTFKVEQDATLNSIVLNASYDEGVAINFDNPSGTTQINEGDIVEISYKFKYNYSAAKMLLNLNNANTRFTYISSSNTSGDTSSANWADTKEGRILSMYMNNGWMAVSDTKQSNATIPKDEWNTVTVTINTKDADHGNRQTLTAKSGNWNLVGYFDANYTGSDDATYDLLSSISSLQFDTYGWYADYGCGAKFYIDDLKVDVKKNVARDVLVSDLSNVVLNETFDNLEDIATGKETTLPGTSFTFKNTWWAGNTITFEKEMVGDNAVAKITAPGGSVMKADLGNVVIGANDEIHVSYDRQSQPSWRSGINCGYSAADTDVGTLITSLTDSTEKGKGKAAIEANINGKLLIGGIEDSDCWITDGSQLHVEYVIKVSDPEHGNKQTVTYTVTGPEDSMRNSQHAKSSSWSRTYYIDADNTTPEEDKFTSLNNFGACVEGASAYNLDNVKVEVVKPGFEVDGVANTGNTYTFRTNDPIDLKYVVDASAASKVIVAQYGADKRMIDATTENVSATDTVTVTPNPSAKTIKVMVLDMSNARPYTKVFVMTRQ